MSKVRIHNNIDMDQKNTLELEERIINFQQKYLKKKNAWS
ncbi:hypothetical protein JCM19296_37 [Nonlabens ulvanivorans]|uniref:Uncharacterized protein n=1 Tax=Nonlabens ulvanivorans TaxID=906888 RepID=A0A081D6B3_NONUL|nr:hypothetical protein JCM19296_37 [Nonlabens ulvanivorans]